MTTKFFTIFLILFCSLYSFSQEQNVGALYIENGTLLFVNSESPFTIELIGEVDLEQFPLLGVNDNSFQVIQNTVATNGKDEKSILVEYRNWEMDHINQMLPEKVVSQSEFITSKNEILSFWYYTNPVLKDAPADITPYKMSLFLDWRKDNMVFRIVHPSFSADIDKSKKLLLDFKKGIRYYSNKIDLDRLSENIAKGQNFYVE